MVVAHTFYLSFWKAEVGKSQFEDILVYKVSFRIAIYINNNHKINENTVLKRNDNFKLCTYVPHVPVYICEYT